MTRDCRISIPCTTEQRDEIDRRAAEAKLPRSTWLLRLALGDDVEIEDGRRQRHLATVEDGRSRRWAAFRARARTMLEVTPVDHVRLLAEGEPIDGVPRALDLDRPLSKHEQTIVRQEAQIELTRRAS